MNNLVFFSLISNLGSSMWCSTIFSKLMCNLISCDIVMLFFGSLVSFQIVVHNFCYYVSYRHKVSTVKDYKQVNSLHQGGQTGLSQTVLPLSQVKGKTKGTFPQLMAFAGHGSMLYASKQPHKRMKMLC